MAGAAGEIYFIGEVDLKSKSHSNYYKIGIVRESDERTTVNRLAEHQTGNPRRLIRTRQAAKYCPGNSPQPFQ